MGQRGQQRGPVHLTDAQVQDQLRFRHRVCRGSSDPSVLSRGGRQNSATRPTPASVALRNGPATDFTNYKTPHASVEDVDPIVQVERGGDLDLHQVRDTWDKLRYTGALMLNVRTTIPLLLEAMDGVSGC